LNPGLAKVLVALGSVAVKELAAQAVKHGVPAVQKALRSGMPFVQKRMRKIVDSETPKRMQ
jgi:hypothetical protein